jgi:hypothetical protein
MGVVVAVIVVGALVWFSFGRYVRVLSRKRFDTRQREVPDLTRFAEGPPDRIPKTRDSKGDS